MNGDSRLVFSWPPEKHLGPQPAPSAKAAHGFLELGRRLASTQASPFEGTGIVNIAY